MAGSTNKLSEWQLKRKRQLEALLKQREFQTKAAAIRTQKDDQQARYEATLALIRNNLPPDCTPFLVEYIATGKKRWELIRPPVLVLSHKSRTLGPSENAAMMYAMYTRAHEDIEETQTQLIIESGATKKEVMDFIESDWRIIQPTKASRVRERPYADRDDEIYELSKFKKPKEIHAELAARGFDLTEPHIRKIIERERKRHRDI